MMFDQKANTLLTLVQEGSFTKAAQALSLSQPAVSHQIRQLDSASKFSTRTGKSCVPPRRAQF